MLGLNFGIVLSLKTSKLDVQKDGNDFSSHGENVEVEVIIDNGDTTVVVIIDGKKLSDEEAKMFFIDTVSSK